MTKMKGEKVKSEKAKDKLNFFNFWPNGDCPWLVIA
jgi:hypothetical protein